MFIPKETPTEHPWVAQQLSQPLTGMRRERCGHSQRTTVAVEKVLSFPRQSVGLHWRPQEPYGKNRHPPGQKRMFSPTWVSVDTQVLQRESFMNFCIQQSTVPPTFVLRTCSVVHPLWTLLAVIYFPAVWKERSLWQEFHLRCRLPVGCKLFSTHGYLLFGSFSKGPKPFLPRMLTHGQS